MKYPYFWRYPNFLTSEWKEIPYLNQLDPFSRFDTTPVCDRRHTTTAYTALAYRVARWRGFCDHLSLQSFCLPVILYGLEVTEPQKSVLTMLNNLINRAVYKIFKVSDKDVICHVKQCLGLHDIDVLCKERHDRFLRRSGLLRHAVLHSLTAQYSFL